MDSLSPEMGSSFLGRSVSESDNVMLDKGLS
jgi:hypothetical protein